MPVRPVRSFPKRALLRQVCGRTMFAPTFSIRQSRCFLTYWRGLCPRQCVEKPSSAREVPRRGGGREPCHNPKYFGQSYSSLPHRLRAEPPRRGGQGVNASFLTVWRGLCPRESLPSQGRWLSDSDGRRGFFATRQRECFLLYSVSFPHASHAHTRPHRPNRPMPMPVSRSGRVSMPRAASNRVWGSSSPVQSRNAPVPAA